MKKLVFLVLLFVTSLSFGQAIDTSKWIRNDGSFNYNNWKVRNNLIIPTKTDTSNKIAGLTQIIGTDLYFVATDHKWKTYISDTSGIHTQLVNQLAAIQANASSINGKQSQLNGNGFVKATGSTISYDNTSYVSDTSALHNNKVDKSTTIKINGVTKDLSANQDWGTIGGTGGTTINGTGFVKATGTSISYDNTSYFPATGGVLSGTAGNGYVGFTPQSITPTVPPSGFKLFASSAGAFSWLTTQGYMRELRIRNQNQDFIGYLQNKPSYTIGDSADIAGKENALTFIAPVSRTGNTVGVDTSTAITGLVTKGFLASQNFGSGSGSGGGSSSTFTTQTYTSGTTATIGNTVDWLIVDPPATVSGLTITMPATPLDRQEVTISFGGVIASGNDVVTGLSVLANSGQGLIQNFAPTYFQSGESITWKYNLQTSKWYSK